VPCAFWVCIYSTPRKPCAFFFLLAGCFLLCPFFVRSACPLTLMFFPLQRGFSSTDLFFFSSNGFTQCLPEASFPLLGPLFTVSNYYYRFLLYSQNPNKNDDSGKFFTLLVYPSLSFFLSFFLSLVLYVSFVLLHLLQLRLLLSFQFIRFFASLFCFSLFLPVSLPTVSPPLFKSHLRCVKE